MHTVSLFPQFLDYQMIGIFLLRVTLGFIFVNSWYENSTRKNTELLHFFEKISHRVGNYYFSIASSLLGVAGVLLIVGLYTQGASIVTGTLMMFMTLIKWHKTSSFPKYPVGYYVILAIASFALLFLGAGAFAVDLAV